jgi:hypothetical protein
LTTSPPNFTSGPESNYAGVVPLGDPSEAEPAGPPAPRGTSRIRQVTAASLAAAAAVAAVISTLVPYQTVSTTSAAGSPIFTVSLTAWGQSIAPSPGQWWSQDAVALFGIPYSLAAVVLVVSAGLLLGTAGTRGYRIAQLTVTAGATAVLSMFAMMAANVIAFVSSGDSESVIPSRTRYDSGPGIWGFLIVAVLGVAAAVLALWPTAKTTESEMATPPMGFPMPPQPMPQRPVESAPQAPQVAEIPESPLNR